MKNTLLAILLFFVLNGVSQVPYNVNPDWESTPAGRVSTGLGLADINGDGFKDMVVADGNDIHRQRLTVHYNLGDGTFNQQPDWESADIDYHGHLAVADFNNDKWIDVAVSVYIGAAGFSQPGMLKVYYNQGGQLESTPSFESMPFYTFSCAVGDANSDGWPDIAVACGEPYSQISDYGRIYYNNNGTFSDDNIWQSDIQMASIDVEFGHIFHNGYLDVVFTGEGAPNYIYAADNQGIIQTSPAWQSTDADNYINSVDVVYNEHITPYSTFVVMTGNDQLGGDGRVKLYAFDSEPHETVPVWESGPFGYGSGVLLSDVNDNDTIDLIYGGWWLPVNIALNQGFGFEMDPSFTSSTNSVVEAIATADLSNSSIYNKMVHYSFSAHSNIFMIKDKDVESVDSVKHENTLLDESEWTYIPGKNWILLKNTYSPGQHLYAYYKASNHRDIVVTNWDESVGNYIFYNSHSPVGQPENIVADGTTLYPNPADDILNIASNAAISEVKVYDVTGKTVATFQENYDKGLRLSTKELANGYYIITIKCNQGIIAKKLIVQHH